MADPAPPTKELAVVGSDPAQDEKPKTPSSEKTNEDVVYISGMKLVLLLSSVTLCAFLMLLDLAIMAPAIPYITTAFKSLPDAGWYAGAYPLAHSALQPMTGKLYTYFKVKWIFLIFLIIFELGSLLCGCANSSSMLIAGRAISGIGASGIMNGGMTVIAGATPLHKRPFYTGIMLGIAFTGIILGPVVGGVFTQEVSWRWCFFINLPIGGAAGLFLFAIQVPDLTVKENFSMALVRKVIPELDLIGFVLFAPCAIMLLLALQFGSEGSYAWNSSVIIGLFCGCGALTIVFVFWERYMGDRAMIPGSIVSHRTVWSSAIVNAALMMSSVVTSNFMALYFQSVKGVGPLLSGVYSLPAIVPQMLFAVASGAFITKVGYYIPPAVFAAVIVTIGNGLISTFSPHTTTAAWIGYQILQGAGRGAGMQVGPTAVQSALPPEQIPISLAFIMFTQNLAASIFVVIATTIFTRTIVSEIEHRAPSVSPQAALAAGADAAAVRALVPPGSPELEGVLWSFSKGFDNIYYMLVAISVVAFGFSWLMGWSDVRKDKGKDREGEKEKGGGVV